MRIDISCVGSRFNMYRNVIALLHHALIDAGHDVTVSHNRIDSGALSIVLPPQAFRLPDLVDHLAGGRARYMVLGIETFDGYSHGCSPQAPDDHGSFHRFLANAAAVLCPFRQDVDLYRGMTPCPLYMRYGSHPALCEIRDTRERPVDLFFFGDLERYPARERVVRRLRDAGLTVDVLGNSSLAPHELVRNSRIARAKIDLNIAHAEHVSPQRVVYLANNRRCCVSNIVSDPDGYLAATSPMSDEDALVDACRSIAADGSWRSRGEQAYEVVRGWPMTEIVAAALDEAL